MKRPYPWKYRVCHERKVYPVRVDYTTTLEHDGRVYSVAVPNLEILRCEQCGAQQLPDEAQAKLFAALRQQADLITPAQIAARREQLGLNQKDFAHLLGVAPATVGRWETGTQIQQRAMNDFLKALFDLPLCGFI